VTRHQDGARPRLGRDFSRFWTAATVSLIGDGVSAAAVPLLAASLTANAALVGLSASVTSLPWLFFGLVSGALVDRWDRLRVMWIVDCARFALVAGLATAIATGHGSIGLLLAVGFVLGIGQTLFDTASEAVVPLLVPQGEGQRLLEKANSRRSFSETSAQQFLGPPSGGFLFGVAASVPLFADAVSFGLSSLLVRGLARRRERSAPRSPDRTPARSRSMLAETREGLVWLWRQPTLRTLAVTVGVTNLAYSASSAILVLYAQRRLELGATAYWLLLTAVAVGGILGSLLATTVSRVLGPGRSLAAALFLLAASRAGLGFTDDVVAATGCLMAAGLALSVFAVVAMSLRQRLVPDSLRGRVVSAYRLLALGTEPVGAALGGLAAAHAGVRAPFLLGAAMIAVLSVVTAHALPNRALQVAEAVHPAARGA
jgi:MFS family permease